MQAIETNLSLRWYWSICAIWVLVVGTGFSAFLVYKLTPGTVRRSPPIWPSNACIPRSDQPTVLLFAHPRCPCTRSTLNELAQLRCSPPKPFSLRIIFTTPSQSGPEWNGTDTIAQARAIPGAEVVFDSDGQLASLFEATISGQILMYDDQGKLRFSGGITPLRGHEGVSVGKDTLVRVLSGELIEGLSPVFGCRLAGSKQKDEYRNGR